MHTAHILVCIVHEAVTEHLQTLSKLHDAQLITRIIHVPVDDHSTFFISCPISPHQNILLSHFS